MNLVPILLPSTKISLFKSTESSLRESIISNDIKQVKKLLERDETIVNRDISEGDSHMDHIGYAALHYVCEYNTQTKLLEVLLKKSASVNIRTNNEEDRSTPLHIAVKFSKMEIIKCLLKNQANPNETDYLGETVLMKAASRGDVKLVDLLLCCGASINSKDFRGQTPLMMSIKGQKIPILQLFLGKHRLLVNEQDNMRNTALMRAIQLNYLDAVYFLLQHPDIDVNLKNEKEETALMLAAAGGYSTIIEWLLDKEAFSSVTNADDETALDILHKHKSINPLIKRQIHRLLTESEVVAPPDEEESVRGRLTVSGNEVMRGSSSIKMRENSFAMSFSSSSSSAVTRSPSISAPSTPSIGKTDGV